MVNNINNFGVINFYESNSANSHSESKHVEDISPIETPKTATKSAKDIWGIPQKGKYNQVREYMEERKKGDPNFKDFCARHSLRDICSFLTNEFGWDVDEHSLGANINRH